MKIVALCMMFISLTLTAGVNAEKLEKFDFSSPSMLDKKKVELGKVLFYDKILSGNNNISCATCHHALAATGDGLSLPVGEGGTGIGVTRNTGHDNNAIHERVPRNAPHIFNIGAREFTKMFYDGRVAVDFTAPLGFVSPAGSDLPDGLDSVVAVQALFPVTSATEMAGQYGENPQANFAAEGNLVGVWDHIAKKLRAVPEYVERFVEVFDDVFYAEDISYVHAANAIAAFESSAGRFTKSPFDQFLRGNDKALSGNEKKGMRLFYGKAGCVHCHSGKFQTDHEFHAIAMPQIGPGKGNGAFLYEDFGRENVTKDESDRYKFRTPSLRNIAITAPYGHSGAYNTLEAVVSHHLDPVSSLYRYKRGQAVLPFRDDFGFGDFAVLDDPSALEAIALANELPPVRLNKRELRRLLDFLGALTDPAVLDMRDDVPAKVPSGLPIYD